MTQLEAAALPRGIIKSTAEDFVVEELPAYEPSGEGEHLFVRFRKRDITTDAAVRAVAGALSLAPADIGVAGLKDKRAVATQTLSLPRPVSMARAEFEQRARTLSIDGVEPLDARWHPHKLRTGHLAGNRFTVHVRGLVEQSVPAVIARLERAAREGVPNAFGAQRFGHDGDNAEQARAWLSGQMPPPRDPRRRRFLWSALQSALFNEVLARRVRLGTWAIPCAGDWLQKHATGGLFLCEDVEVDRARARAGELSPTGPMVGVKMRLPHGEVAALERAVLGEMLGESFDLARTRQLGEGTRRCLRLWVSDFSVRRAEDAPSGPPPTTGSTLVVRFVLPAGAYATTILGAAVDCNDISGETASGDTASTRPDQGRVPFGSS